jgi:hypothetical protein
MTSEIREDELGKSKALLAFETNLEHIKWLINLFGKAPLGMISDVANAIASMQAELPNLDLQEQRRFLEKIQLKIAPLQRTAGPGWIFLENWMIVMIVTFVEAYLEDFLVMIVQLNPSWCSSEATLTLEDLSDNCTVESLRDKICRRWAKGILRSGNPTNWIRRLESFGVRGYRDDLGEDMEKIWERRHEIVHDPNSQLSDEHQHLKRALEYCGHFVEITDLFLVKLGAAKCSATLETR